MTDEIPLAALDRALAVAGLGFSELRRLARGVAVFGSRAAGCATSASDWDVLCVGAGRSRKVRGLDLVWVEPGMLESSEWLGGDLAGHIAAYGVWLDGAPAWEVGAVDFATAASRKETRLFRSLRALAPAWNMLGPAYRAKHATLLRRDVQRWRVLQNSLPIPPSAVLDGRFRAEGGRDGLGEALIALGARPDLAGEIEACAGLTLL
jgi:hypothetical protein